MFLGYRKGGILIAAAALSAVVFWFLVPHQPYYQGKPIKNWLRDFDFGSRRGAAARVAIREMGTNSLPILIRLLGHHDNRVQQKFQTFLARHGLWSAQFESDFQWHRRAALALAELGSAAAPALTALAAAGTNSQAPDQVMEALSKMLPTSTPVLTNLVVTCGSQMARDKAMCVLVDACSYPDFASMSVLGLSNALQNFEIDYTAIVQLAKLRDGNYPTETKEAAAEALSMARPLPQYPYAVNSLLMGAADRAKELHRPSEN